MGTLAAWARCKLKYAVIGPYFNIGSKPGKLLQKLAKVKVEKPSYSWLDEIDKWAMGSAW